MEYWTMNHERRAKVKNIMAVLSFAVLLLIVNAVVPMHPFFAVAGTFACLIVFYAAVLIKQNS